MNYLSNSRLITKAHDVEIGRMKDQLIAKLSLIDDSCFCPDCINLIIYIEEDDVTNKSYVITDPDYDNGDEKAFCCYNGDSFTLTHLAIDNCVMTPERGYDGKKCDFFIFTSEIAAFVELKTNAYSTNNVSRHITKAYSQLKSTIEYFAERDVDYGTRDKEAYIVLRTPLYPPNPISQLSRRRSFFMHTRFDLIEHNSINI